MLAIDYPRQSPHFLNCRRAVRGINGPVVVGLSGGPDSLALMVALLAEDIETHAVIVDHQLQAGSGEIALGARRQAFNLGATAEIVTIEVPVGGDGPEAEARRARHQALRELAGERPVILGHTLDDQAETLLLAALRGHSAGMLPENGGLVRPFLNVRRADTVGTCRELGLEYWSDPHNDDPRFRRVAIRQQILPALSGLIDGDAALPLARAASLAAEDNALLNRLAGQPTTDCRELAELAGPLRRRLIAQWLRGKNLKVSTAIIAAVETLVIDYHGQGGVAAGAKDGRRLEVCRIGGKLAVIVQH